MPEVPLYLPDGLENNPDILGIPNVGSSLKSCTNRTFNEICWEYGAIGSGMNSLGCEDDEDLSTCIFVGISDRGPNQDCEDMGVRDSGKGFPVSNFAPVITTFKLGANNLVEIVAQTHMTDSAGVPVTGITNTEVDDTPYSLNCAEPLAYDQNGKFEKLVPA